MDADLKAKWVEALRSEKYKQAIGLLKDGDSFCCLGVLCSVMGADWTSGDPVLVKDDEEFPLKDSMGDELLGDSGVRLAGIKEQMLLAEMNDNGKSFAEIADYIEAHL